MNVDNQVPKDIDNVEGIDVLLEDILVNLLHNAAEAGALNIEIKAEHQLESQMMDLIVQDDGRGIRDEDCAVCLHAVLFDQEDQQTRWRWLMGFANPDSQYGRPIDPGEAEQAH